jgi:Rrf2 family nitric oxide-sensitive transcriptional repressor
MGILNTYLSQDLSGANAKTALILFFPTPSCVQLTYHTDYALRVLIYMISRPGQKVTTREMAEFYGISLNHLTKVAKTLTKTGWLKATRGVGGGLLLAEHTPNAKIGEIVRQMEKRHLVECFDAVRNTCPIARGCELKPILYFAWRAFYDVLDAHTVRDLAKTPAELLTPMLSQAKVKVKAAGITNGAPMTVASNPGRAKTKRKPIS